LRRSTVATLAGLCRVLGVDESPELIGAAVEANRFERLTEGRAAGAEDSASFLRSGTVGDWRRVFTAEDRAAFKRAGGDLLIALGYETADAW
jgi:hypothetical protein